MTVRRTDPAPEPASPQPMPEASAQVTQVAPQAPIAQQPPTPQQPPQQPGQPTPPQGMPPQGMPPQGMPPQGMPPAGPPGFGPGGHAGGPVAPKVNPFIGWPISDYVRDAAAAVCLFSVLGMPWAWGNSFLGEKGSEYWWVIIAVLISVASLAVPYLSKAQVVPGWTPTHYRLLKWGLQLPLIASVFAALINELVNINEAGEGGFGSGIAMGLAGVALAAQPRQAEEEPGGSDDALWNKIAAGAVLAALVVHVLLLIGWFAHGTIGDGEIFDEFTEFLALVVSAILTPIAVVGLAAFRVLTNPAPAHGRVFATVGFTVLVVALFSLASDRDGLFFWPWVEKWNGFFDGMVPTGGLLLLGAAAALVLCRARVRTWSGTEPVQGWLDTAQAAFLVSAAGAAVFAVTIIVSMIADDDFGAGGVIVAILSAAIAGGAGYAFTLMTDIRRNRTVALGLIGGMIILGWVVMGVANGSDAAFYGINGWVVAALFTLPALAAYALVGPAPVRSALGPLVVPGAGQQAPGFPAGGQAPGQPQYPGQQAPPQPGQYPGQQPQQYQQPVQPPPGQYPGQ